MAKDTDKTIRVTTPPFRASFAHVFKPHSGFEGQEPKYSIQMLFPKETDLTKMKAAVREAIERKWGKDKTKWPKFKHPVFKDGNEKNLEDYKNMTVCEARTKMKPGIVDRDGEREIIDASEFYSGCWARATLSVFTYEKLGNKGVSFGLQNIQKLKDDTAFSGKRNAKDDFADAEEINMGDDNGTASDEDFETADATSEDDF